MFLLVIEFLENLKNLENANDVDNELFKFQQEFHYINLEYTTRILRGVDKEKIHAELDKRIEFVKAKQNLFKEILVIKRIINAQIDGLGKLEKTQEDEINYFIFNFREIAYVKKDLSHQIEFLEKLKMMEDIKNIDEELSRFQQEFRYMGLKYTTETLGKFNQEEIQIKLDERIEFVKTKQNLFLGVLESIKDLQKKINDFINDYIIIILDQHNVKSKIDKIQNIVRGIDAVNPFQSIENEYFENQSIETLRFEGISLKKPLAEKLEEQINKWEQIVNDKKIISHHVAFYFAILVMSQDNIINNSEDLNNVFEDFLFDIKYIRDDNQNRLKEFKKLQSQTLQELEKSYYQEYNREDQ